MLSYDEYLIYYEKYKRLPNGQYCSKKPLNERQLKSKYDKYCKSIQKKKDTIKRQIEKQKNKPFKKPKPIKNKKQSNSDWLKCKKIVFERDNNNCRLWPLLSLEEKSKVKNYIYQGSEFATIDPAHVISQSQSKKLQYNPDNIICLYRLFHTRLDNYQDPITGKYLEGKTTEERKQKRKDWFIKIIGKDLFEWLEENK